MPKAVRTRFERVLAAVLLLAGAAVLLPAPARAATVGYVRLAHLSPDTPAVDVYLTSVAGGAARKFPAVGYGTVSTYLALDAGTYSVAMRNVGAAESTQPVLSTSVTVEAGGAYTVAGVGRFADLGLRVINDDLKLPTPGKAKVRVVNASVRAPQLDVSVATTGATIATAAAFATTTGYREVEPGAWPLRLQPTGSTNATEVAANCAAGGVYSVLVLDGKNGGLTVEVRVDARAGSQVPVGGVDTGAGGSAPFPWVRTAAVMLMSLLVAAGVLVAVRRRPPGGSGPARLAPGAGAAGEAAAAVTGADWRVIRHRSGTRNLLIALAVVVVVGLVAGGAVMLRRDDGSPATTAAPGASASATPGPLTIEAAPATEPVQLPPPARVRIAAIGVDSPLESLALDAAGVLQVPTDYGRAGWYAAGVAPGEIGPAVIAGHVDSAAGPAVFYRLRDLKAGDVVEVARGDQWIPFRVVASERYPKDQFPTERVYRPAPVPELRLITCGGTFDRSRRSYEDNIVVYAVAV